MLWWSETCMGMEVPAKHGNLYLQEDCDVNSLFSTKMGPLVHCHGNVNWCSHYEEQHEISKKLKQKINY